MTTLPSFVEHQGVTVKVPGVGEVVVDIVYSGMWYVVVEAGQVGLALEPGQGRNIARVGEMIKTAAREQWPVQHPDNSYTGPDILAFTGPPSDKAPDNTRLVTETVGK